MVTTVTPESPGIPRAMVLTVSFALSSVTGLVCHRRRQNCFRQLDASVGASGPHDFAVRVGALVRSAARVHRIPPRVRDDRETPLRGTGCESVYCCFYPPSSEISENQKLVLSVAGETTSFRGDANGSGLWPAR
jgi:hypothetical protein